MRPEKLFPLFSEITRLKGVGPGAKKALGRLFYGSDDAHPVVKDVLFHLPSGVIDRRRSPSLGTAKSGDIVTWTVTVQAHQPPVKKRGAKLPYKIVCHTAEGFLTLIFFHARPEHIMKMLPAGSRKVVSGKFERYDGFAQIAHPDVIAEPEEFEKITVLEPIYPLTGGMTNRHLGKIIASACRLLPDLPEWIESAYLRQQRWKAWKAALLLAHNPRQAQDVMPSGDARERLAYDELLAHQLALALLRAHLRKPVATPILSGSSLRRRVVAGLPYRLTQGQTQVLEEISHDMAGGTRMLRLLQGDVGSGKTIVAILAATSTIEAGRQAALLVPTELLGRQHHAFVQRVLEPLGVRCLLLTGGMKPSARAEALSQIRDGDIDLIIGTHAIIQDKMVFHDLGLAVIDEQHRFGVTQRLALTVANPDAHLLVMTATPIPRTLALTAFGDMDSSILAEKPAGRLQIATKAIPSSRTEEVLEGIARAIAKGEKVYWICPLVEESDDENAPRDLAAARARHLEFMQRFEDKVGLVHGRMPAAERDGIMRDFAGNRLSILVATTVVEVGVDVPDATVIVIEHAERFGLAQLHQLRGRVGRSDRPSTCILLYTDRCGEIAQSRLKAIRQSNDGFRIAEEDWKLRGGGDILGVRQSGLPNFHFADLNLHYDLLRAARDDARLILHRDPDLTSERGAALKYLLHLFGHAETRFLNAG